MVRPNVVLEGEPGEQQALEELVAVGEVEGVEEEVAHHHHHLEGRWTG